MRGTPKQAELGVLRQVCQGRGERTRQRLIEVAVEVFGERGFDGADTRTIVDQAGTNLVSILYYFGSKEGLYLASADYVGRRVAEKFVPICQWAKDSLEHSPSGRGDILVLYGRFMGGVARTILGENSPSFWGRFVGREQFDPSSAASILWQHFEPLFSLSLEFVSRLTGSAVHTPHAILQNLTVFAMVKCSCVDSVCIAKAMSWTNFGEKEISVIEDTLVANIRALFSPSRYGV